MNSSLKVKRQDTDLPVLFSRSSSNVIVLIQPLIYRSVKTDSGLCNANKWARTGLGQCEMFHYGRTLGLAMCGATREM